MNNLQNAQYGVLPYERREIIIGSSVLANAPDRSNGEFISNLEGSGFYIERCDWPALITVNSQGGGIATSINARDGLEFKAPFKGLTITHPQLNVAAALSIFLLKNGAEFTNNLDNPVSRLNVSYRSVASSGNSQTVAIFVPPGARSIKNLQIVSPGAASAGASVATFVDKNGNTIFPPTSLTQNVGGTLQSYTGGASGTYGNTVLQGGIALGIFPNVFIPTACSEIYVTITGTTLGAAYPTGNFE